MASEDRSPPRFPTPQSIPLQDLSRPPDDDDHDSRLPRSGGRSSVRSPRRVVFGRTQGSRYERLQEGSPSPPYRSEANGPLSTVPRLQISPYVSNEDVHSPVDDLPTFAAATGSLGLSFGPSEPSWLPSGNTTRESTRPTINSTTANSSYSEPSRQASFDAEDHLPLGDAETAPLTGDGYLHPVTGANANQPSGQRHDREGTRQSVHWTDSESAGPSPRRSHGSRLGDDLHNLEEGQALGRMEGAGTGISRGMSVLGGRRSRSQSPSASISPIARANSMLRMMSQRVVNLSNDTEMVERSIQRKSSVRSSRLESPPVFPAMLGDAHDDTAEAGMRPPNPIEKLPSTTEFQSGHGPVIHPNPLKGRSLGLFGPENKIRRGLCEMLVHPVTEPLILVLIVVQTILLALDSAQSVYNDPRATKWGTHKTDFALFVLFVIYTLEVIARTIVSGFILNPTEYSTLDRSLGLRKAMIEQCRNLFAPQRQRSTKKKAAAVPAQPSIIRSFTGLQQNIELPGHGRQHQRIRLAKRAFLRHSFNRLDFIAVVSFWISFALAFSRVESNQHIYVFRMLSALRILRLLGLTSGTSVILRSLKKAAPLLVNVAFLISFFWLLFAIVGVQSFKSSFRRTCVWLGQDGQSNYTRNIAPDKIQFCGGYLDAETAEPMPWKTAGGLNGTAKHKGYLCPQGSICVEGGNPYNGTVSFDNTANSLQLIFVTISSNTFSNLLYYLTETDYLAAAIFFAGAIVIMSLWLMNLLVAVITSSFQIIREESKRSAFATERIEENVTDEDVSKRKTLLRRLYDKT